MEEAPISLIGCPYFVNEDLNRYNKKAKLKNGIVYKYNN